MQVLGLLSTQRRRPACEHVMSDAPGSRVDAFGQRAFVAGVSLWFRRCGASVRATASKECDARDRAWSAPYAVGFCQTETCLAAVARERFALPSAPALAQSHAGKLRHEVELRGPHVAEGTRGALDRPVDELEVVRDQALPRDVVLVDPPMRLAEVEDDVRLAGREPLEVGDSDLDDEAAAWLEMRRDIAEARDLGRPASSGS